MPGAAHEGYLGIEAAPLVAVIVATAVGAALLLGLASAAVRRGHSRSYVLIAGAIAALLARPLAAAVATAGLVSPIDHHAIEHVLDLVIVVLVLAAIYEARSVSNA